MAEIGLPQPQPSVGIKGNPKDTEVLKSHEKAQVSSSVPGYAQALTSLATTPTALGQFATELAMNSSNALAKKWGYEEGLKPSGNAFPAITKFDQAFTDAYTTQSQNTLGLQANKLLLDGQNELSKAWKITPGLIDSYTQNMQKGLSDIYNMAPDAVKGSLQLQYETNLLRSKSALNNKMVSQQHSEALQKAAIENKNQLTSIYEAARSGDAETAETLQKDLIGKGERMHSAGMISPSQVQTIKDSAKTTYYSGLYTGQAIKAFNEKKVDDYLANFMQHKPAGLNTLEYEKIAKNVLSEVQLQESFQKRNEQSLYSEGTRLLNEGLLTPDFIHQLETETTDKAEFNSFMSKVAVNRKKNAAAMDGARSIIPSWTNTDVMAVASKKDKNNGLILATQDTLQMAASRGREITPEQAEVEVMSTAAVPIPNFTDKMNRGLLSGNPDVMMAKLQAYNLLRESNPRVLNGITGDAKAMLTQFELQLEDGNQPDVAAQKAYEVVQQKTPEQMEINKDLIQQWQNKYVNTPSRLNSWASQFVDNGRGTAVDNLPAFAIHAKNIFESNMNYHNGDIQAATKDTADGLDRAWGVTELNGRKEFTFQPVEKTIGLDAGAVPLIREDLHEQLKAQIEPMNKAYEEGKTKKDKRMSFYYRLPERPTFKDYHDAQLTISNYKSSRSPETTKSADIQKAIDTINNYRNDELTIERVHDSGRIEKFTVTTKANPGLQVDENSGIVGSYNVMIRGDTGPSSPMNGWFKGPLSEPIYLPSGNKIRERYSQLNGIDTSNLSAKEIYDIWLKRKEAKDVLRKAYKPFAMVN